MKNKSITKTSKQINYLEEQKKKTKTLPSTKTDKQTNHLEEKTKNKKACDKCILTVDINSSQGLFKGASLSDCLTVTIIHNL